MKYIAKRDVCPSSPPGRLESSGWRIAVIPLFVFATLAAAPCFGQAKSGSEDKIPSPEPVSLTTRDGLVLKATYYPPPQTKKKGAGRKTVPIVMLHDYKANRNIYKQLATFLQREGRAVLVPDLRGHGESTSFKNPRIRNLEAARLRPLDFARMVTEDMRAVRKFLLAKNDKGELNLNRLCIVGAEMGAAVAINWAAADWSWPELPNVKQGKDVKALVLISPEWNFKGLSIRAAQEHPAIRSDRVAMLILVGKEKARPRRDAERLYSALEPFHSKPEDETQHEKKFLVLGKLPTSLQGTKMLEEMLKIDDLKLASKIGKFIEWRAADPDFAWSRRGRE